MQNTSARPTGVTILAVLAFIGGVLGILGALLLMVGGAAASTVDAGIGGSALIYGILSLAVSVAYLAFGIGAWGLKPWAWSLGIIIAGASVVLAIISVLLQWNTITGVILNVIISGVILYYLFTPGVKAAFGRA